MVTEIRPCNGPEELAEYGRIVSYVFASTEGMDEELASTQPDWTTCGFVDGKMVATLGTFPFTVRFNGAPVAMGGVTAVGTLPSHRRQGVLRKIMAEALSTMRDRHQSYAILWASMAAIYQRFGYGLATTEGSYEFDPRTVAFQRPVETPGSMELMTKEDAFPIIKQIYVQHATPRNLHIHRSVPLWTASTLRPPKKGQPLYIAVYRNSSGEARGYMVYSTSEEPLPQPGPDHVMALRDFIALDLEAQAALWEYIRRHDLVGKVTFRGVPEDDSLPALLLEPRMLNRKTSDGIWMRVVDVEQALPQRPYGARGELTFAIEGDALCPWNNGTYLLETDGPSATVQRTTRAAQLTMSPNTLATLVSGHRSATFNHRAGLLTASDPAILQTADALFRTEYAPHCPNGF
ncbi:MAG: GNAT family N-acetyltransferase [Tepidiformaceae bacterium]